MKNLPPLDAENDKVPHDKLLMPLKITWYLTNKKAEMQLFEYDPTFCEWFKV